MLSWLDITLRGLNQSDFKRDEDGDNKDDKDEGDDDDTGTPTPGGLKRNL